MIEQEKIEHTRRLKLAHYHRNKDEINKRVRIRRKSEPTRFNEYTRKWREKNRDRMRALKTAWRKKNLHRHSATETKRRALKRNLTVGDLTEIAKVYERAKWWRQWFDVAVDHIIPLARNGTHEASNLQIIYRFDNLRKCVSMDYKPRVIFL